MALSTNAATECHELLRKSSVIILQRSCTIEGQPLSNDSGMYVQFSAVGGPKNIFVTRKFSFSPMPAITLVRFLFLVGRHTNTSRPEKSHKAARRSDFAKL